MEKEEIVMKRKAMGLTQSLEGPPLHGFAEEAEPRRQQQDAQLGFDVPAKFAHRHAAGWVARRVSA